MLFFTVTSAWRDRPFGAKPGAQGAFDVNFKNVIITLI
jgi:hypothetical protein